MSQEPAPEVQGVPVTALNWQDPPANRWAFWHVGDILPTYRVPRGGDAPRPLPAAAARPDLLSVPVTRMDRTPGAQSASTVGDVLGDTYTDAYLVLQDGALVTEWYGPLGAPDRPHALMSVSKSVVGCVAAVLIDRGQLDPDAEITSYVPELAGSGYAGALVRHVYDMRSGVRFLEEYANPDSDIRRLDEWVEWQPGQGEPRGLYRFLATLQAEAPHGERFLYRSAESDVLGWVCERAAGRPMAELISELIWAPIGAEHDALLLHDGLGTAVHDGGLCATARDVARFGQMLLDGGLVPDGAGGTRRVVPPQWLRRAWAVDADARGVFAASPAEWAFPGGWYRHQFWFRPGAYGDVLLCLGIHGQMLHVSRRTNTVCVKFSAWPDAQNPAYLEDTLRAFDAVGGFLAGRAPAGPGGRRLAGVVSGLSRRLDGGPTRA
ncbi:MAG TPA: serine hydrolase [Streptosporangiaceae bacterium]|nr:serine hydrolase [Streptosporangiaceae bacterium]